MTVVEWLTTPVDLSLGPSLGPRSPNRPPSAFAIRNTAGTGVGIGVGTGAWSAVVSHSVILEFERLSGCSTLDSTSFSIHRLSASHIRYLCLALAHRTDPIPTAISIGRLLSRTHLPTLKQTLVRIWDASMPDPDSIRPADSDSSSTHPRTQYSTLSFDAQCKLYSIDLTTLSPADRIRLSRLDISVWTKHDWHRWRSYKQFPLKPTLRPEIYEAEEKERSSSRRAAPRKSWLDLWSIARHDLHLSDSDWLSYTPRMVHALEQRRLQEMQHLELIGAITSSTVATFSERSPEKAPAPERFMIHPIRRDGDSDGSDRDVKPVSGEEVMSVLGNFGKTG